MPRQPALTRVVTCCFSGPLLPTVQQVPGHSGIRRPAKVWRGRSLTAPQHATRARLRIAPDPDRPLGQSSSVHLCMVRAAGPSVSGNTPCDFWPQRFWKHSMRCVQTSLLLPPPQELRCPGQGPQHAAAASEHTGAAQSRQRRGAAAAWQPSRRGATTAEGECPPVLVRSGWGCMVVEMRTAGQPLASRFSQWG